MTIRDRLMSRVSVAAMAAHAKPGEGGADTSKVGQPERVEDSAAGGGDDGGDSIDSLSPEEMAQFEQVKSGQAPEPVDDGGDDGDDGEPAGDGDGEAPADRVAADDGAAADAPAAGRKPPKTINYGRYQKELDKAAKAQADLQAALEAARGETAKEREARVRLDERTKQLLEAIQQRQAPEAPKVDEDPEPDGEADPIGNLQWHNRQLAKRVEDLSGGVQQREQQTAAEREEAQVLNTLSADLERAAGADPSFGDAFVHLRETRYRELGFIYADIDITDPEQCKRLSPDDQARLSQSIQKSFHNEQLLVARQAIAARKSPASVVRNLAVARGFVPKAAAPAGAPAPAPRGNGRPSVPDAPAGRPTVKDELAAIRDGLGSSRSLSDAGGSPGETITPQALAEMSDDEFADLYNSLPKAKLDKMMGKTN